MLEASFSVRVRALLISLTLTSCRLSTLVITGITLFLTSGSVKSISSSISTPKLLAIASAYLVVGIKPSSSGLSEAGVNLSTRPRAVFIFLLLYHNLNRIQNLYYFL